jgi:23S rRNA pseudouridine1911/1915/1917 synthase
MTVERYIAQISERLDISLARQLGITRAFAQKLIREGHVSLESLNDPSFKIKPSYKISEGQSFSVSIPPTQILGIEPEDVFFEVAHEDPYLLVIDKPAGLVVHPASGHWTGTLVHGLLFRYPDLGPFNNVARPGIVHRLDATTSGLMLVAREQRTMEALQKDFKERAIEKYYLALVQGRFKRQTGIIEGPIGRNPQNRLKMAVIEGGRDSATEYRVLWNSANYALLICKLLTGRTHQIRVHLAAEGHPLVGDTLYGAQRIEGLNRVFLHSWRLAFNHPVTSRPLSFTSLLPQDLRQCLANLGLPRREKCEVTFGGWRC